MVLADGTSQPIELMKGYDEYGDDCDTVLCRDENDPTGPLLKKRVLQTFTRVSPILNVKVRNRVIGTTAEHPFYARGKGWITASELQFGDRLLTSEGEWIGCEGIEDTGRIQTVYNFEVEDSHTYFVGEKEWGFDVWVHNYTTGIYRTNGGYHIHQGAAFKGNSKYNYGASLTIKTNGFDHIAANVKQRQLQGRLAASGAANTMKAQTGIAIAALRAGGASYKEARSLAATSLNNLRNQGVRTPSRIPWN